MSGFEFSRDGEVAGSVEYGRLQGPVGVLAIHGGGIEPGTEELAQYVADHTDCSLYVFSGRLRKANREAFYVDSTEFQSLQLDAMLGHVDIAVSLHGHGLDDDTLYVGGAQDLALKESFRALMSERLGHYHVVTDTREMSRHFRGIHPDNVINRRGHQGIQIELPRSLRQVEKRALFGERHLLENARTMGDVLVDLVRSVSHGRPRGDFLS